MAKSFVPDLCAGKGDALPCARNGDCAKQALVLEMLGDVQLNSCGLYLPPDDATPPTQPKPPIQPPSGEE